MFQLTRTVEFVDVLFRSLKDPNTRYLNKDFLCQIKAEFTLNHLVPYIPTSSRSMNFTN